MPDINLSFRIPDETCLPILNSLFQTIFLCYPQSSLSINLPVTLSWLRPAIWNSDYISIRNYVAHAVYSESYGCVYVWFFGDKKTICHLIIWRRMFCSNKIGCNIIVKELFARFGGNKFVCFI